MPFLPQRILTKLKKVKSNNIDTNTFFTENENYNDDFSFDDTQVPDLAKENLDISDSKKEENSDNNFSDIKPNDEITSLTTKKEQRLLAVQNMFKKSIRISLKSFLISLSISFLNLFIQKQGKRALAPFSLFLFLNFYISYYVSI